MKNNISTLKGLAIVGGVVMALYFLSYATNPKPRPETVRPEILNTLQDPVAQPISSEDHAKASYMMGCGGDEFVGQNEYCECTYDQIRKISSINQLANDGLTLTSEQMEAKYKKEINYCLATVYGEDVQL